MKKVVLPIAALLVILIAVAVFGGARAPVPAVHEAPADARALPHADAAPVAFDPFTGWGVAGLQHDGPPVARSQAAPPLVEVDPFDRYGVAAPPVFRAHPVTGPWDGQSFAEARATYAPAAALPDAGTGPVTTDADAWWLAAPPDAK
ncbi:MAG: hypothetical protein OXC31_24365 [Spirochaetaceae bacterium]|nr:hypothetical protein [Spirochaetaceae bacterium]